MNNNNGNNNNEAAHGDGGPGNNHIHNNHFVPPVEAAPPAQPPVVIPDSHRLESLEQWLEVNGLRAPNDQNDEDEDRWERIQDRERVAEAQAYETGVWNHAFASHAQEQADAQAVKEQELSALQGQTLTITCGGGGEKVEHINVVPLAAKCETIFALASSWHHFNPQQQEQSPNCGNHDKADHVGIDPKENTGKDSSSSPSSSSSGNSMQLNLPEFSEFAVRTFIDIVVHESVSLQDIVQHEMYQSIHASDELLVELTHLAHYLQHAELLEEAVQILLQKIDTANCLAMTQLADQLHLPRLFEAALSHMMQSVHNLEQDAECWDHLLTPELRQRIAAIQKAIQSSIHDQRSVLYFSSLQEYLAIFAERVNYYKERLAEAMEQQAERPQTADWHYAQCKIERQRVRLHTLQTAFQEQKKLFGTKQQQPKRQQTSQTANSSRTN